MESINHKARLTDIIAPSSIRVIAGTMLPGIVGAWPYLTLAYGKFPWIESVMKDERMAMGGSHRNHPARLWRGIGFQLPGCGAGGNVV